MCELLRGSLDSQFFNFTIFRNKLFGQMNFQESVFPVPTSIESRFKKVEDDGLLYEDSSEIIQLSI